MLNRWAKLCFLVVILMGVLSPVVTTHAAGLDPWNAADQIRTLMFDAQKQVAADAVKAAQSVAQAEQLYRDDLRAPIAAAVPDVATVLDTAFADAQAAATAQSVLTLAATRGWLWSSLLNGSAQVVLDALQRGDNTTAQQWLMLREFRKPTKFARPGADATLAIAGVQQGTKTASDAITAVRIDLLDTYQAKLDESLADADKARTNQFDVRLAEESGLAAGYFNILAPIYGEQRGASAADSVRLHFTTLVNAAKADDLTNFSTGFAAVTADLKHFRAAPLSEAEQARRAGQLMRYLSLVPIEYGRGVRDGKIIHDIEIQEARTFYEGALAAFADLELTLTARDATKTSQVDAQLKQIDAQITNIVEPSALEASVNEITGHLTAMIPQQWITLNSSADFDVINNVLDQVVQAVQAGMYTQAESARIEAYALLDSGVEQKLRGFAPDLALKVEGMFWQGDQDQPGLSVLIANNAKLSEVKAGVAALRSALAEAQTVLDNTKTAPEAVIGNAAIIVFREGLEAVVILASLLASLRAAEQRQWRRSIVVGAALSLVATALTWAIANSIISLLAQFGERLEAVLSIIAIAVLLLITNWFFHKTYWTGWMAELHSRKAQFLGGTFVVGPSLGLVVLGFTSIYREGFETVLFLQSLVLDAGMRIVLEGVGLGLIGVAIVGFLVFNLQMRLPYKSMLIVTGVLIGVVLLTMVGNTVHVLQAVGWMPITPINGLYLPYWMGRWFGLFATWQGVIGQIAAATFVIGSYVLAERMQANERNQKRTRTQKQATVRA